MPAVPLLRPAPAAARFACSKVRAATLTGSGTEIARHKHVREPGSRRCCISDGLYRQRILAARLEPALERVDRLRLDGARPLPRPGAGDGPRLLRLPRNRGRLV